MSGVRASFGGMLLLIAIHFHSNQMTAINDLVSSTLGMKVHAVLTFVSYHLPISFVGMGMCCEKMMMIG